MTARGDKRSGRLMVSPGEVREQAARRYSRIYRDEAAKLFSALARTADESRAEPGGNDRDGAETVLSIALHPPTEQLVLENPTQARSWASAWRESPLGEFAQWETRRWPSVGAQSVPVRIALQGIGRIAACAGKAEEWSAVSDRTAELASRFASCWTGAQAKASPEEVAAAVKKTAGRVLALDDRDWQTALAVIEWLSGPPVELPFVRQLPIAGIDTKWMENHLAVVGPLARAICRVEPDFARPGKLMRTHALDERLAPGGLAELALPIEALDRLPRKPDIVLVCENLVNVLALPPVEGVLALHGGGYAIAELARIELLGELPIIYWGDLDSNGFAILNRLRSHFPHVASTMMDIATLERHIELCVEEPTPFCGELPLLDEGERQALERLRAGDISRGIASLRLEQERIEWGWACERIAEDASRLRA